MTAIDERRANARIALNARVRVRPAGSSDAGTPCRVRDSSADGVRLTVDGRIEALAVEGQIDARWHVLEILPESGRRHDRALQVRVVWIDHAEDGNQHIGCMFGTPARLQE